MNSVARSDLRLMMGQTSTHLMNLSMATRRWSNPPGAFLNSLTMLWHQTVKGQVMWIVWSAYTGRWFYVVLYWNPLYILTMSQVSARAIGQ